MIHEKTIMSPSQFFGGVISALVKQGESAIQPKHPSDLRGFQAMLNVLEKRLEDVEASGTRERKHLLQLLEIRNQLMPSNSGAFDRWGKILRDLQTSAIMSPNPDYDDLVFEFSPTFAESLLDELAEDDQKLVLEVASEFVRAKKNYYVDRSYSRDRTEMVR